MEDISLLRRKTTQVVFGLEEALVKFIKQHKPAAGEKPLEPPAPVEDMYLEDILLFARDLVKGTRQSNAMDGLYKLSKALDLYTIRCSCSHTNKLFFPYYWYRIAALVLDPAIRELELNEVQARFEAAEQGSLEDPPEGWADKYITTLPNNLPDKFESDITDLIGRTKVKKKLYMRMKNPRNATLAIVAPGGIGKTALVLDILRDVCDQPDKIPNTTGVIYLSLKTETWDKKEFVQLETKKELKLFDQLLLEGLGQVLNFEFENFEEAITRFGDSNLIICIDNLEELIREHMQSFNDVIERFPVNWKLIITSRIPVPDASIIQLEALDQKDAIYLARKYHLARNGDELPEEKYQELANEVGCNPLAVKMTIDFLMLGNELPSSLEKAKENVALHSFNNLIEALSEASSQILEVLLLDPKAKRKDMTELLDIDTDGIAAGIMALTNTSLVIQKWEDESELFKINDSVEGFLKVRPNRIDLRSKIQAKVEHKKSLLRDIKTAQQESALPSTDINHIPTGTDPDLVILLHGFNKIHVGKFGMSEQTKNFVLELIQKFKLQEGNYQENHLFLRAYAELHRYIALNLQADEYYQQALSCCNEDHGTMYAAIRFYSRTDHSKSLELSKKLLDILGRDNLSEHPREFVSRVYFGYFTSASELGNYESVLHETKKWKKSPFKKTFGISRALAFKRRSEGAANVNWEVWLDSLVSAAGILGEVVRDDEDYDYRLAIPILKVIGEIGYHLKRRFVAETDTEKTRKLLDFCDVHLESATDISPGRNKQEPMYSKAKTLAEVDISDNPFRDTSKWTDLWAPSAITVSEGDLKENYIKLEVDLCPLLPAGRKKAFLFAKDEENKRYFVHRSVIDGADDAREWNMIQVGDFIASTDLKQPEGIEGKDYPEVIKAYLLNRAAIS